MYYFSFLIILLVGTSGLYLGIVGFREYQKITASTEKVSILQIIKIAVRFGIAGSLIFLGTMIIASVLDEKYIWSIPKIGKSVFISLIPGVIVTLGAVYQIYTTVVFRNMLIRKYKEKDKSENNNS